MSIGITFLPSAQAQSATSGPANAGANNTNLAQAYKILSLRLPQLLGGQAISPLAGTPGTNTDALKGTNPMAAVFSALLQSMNGGLGGDRQINATGLGSGAPPPSIAFGDQKVIGGDAAAAPAATPSLSGSTNPMDAGARPGRGAGY